MNVMTHTLERKPAESASIADIAEMTAGSCVATRVRQLSRIACLPNDFHHLLLPIHMYL